MRWAFCKRADVLEDALTRLASWATMTIPITWVDAFSDRPFGGNPAAVCLLEEPLADERMQSIAFELGIAETAFVTPTDDPTTFGLRWFSPTVEIDLCGHATWPRPMPCATRAWSTARGRSPSTPAAAHSAAAFTGDTIELDFPADPVIPAPLPASLEGQWPGAVVASGRTDFFAFVVLHSAEAVRDGTSPTWRPSRRPGPRRCS